MSNLSLTAELTRAEQDLNPEPHDAPSSMAHGCEHWAGGSHCPLPLGLRAPRGWRAGGPQRSRVFSEHQCGVKAGSLFAGGSFQEALGQLGPFSSEGRGQCGLGHVLLRFSVFSLTASDHFLFSLGQRQL